MRELLLVSADILGAVGVVVLLGAAQWGYMDFAITLLVVLAPYWLWRVWDMP